MYKVHNNLMPDSLKLLLGLENQNLIHTMGRTIPFPNADLDFIENCLFLTLLRNGTALMFWSETTLLSAVLKTS